MTYQTFCGDSLRVLMALPSNSVDALITDPPAGIGLLGLDWDKNKGGKEQWVKWLAAIMRESARVMKPGSHGLVWALPRTSHWTANALEEAGFQIKDVVTHVFGSGFPKSIAIDKAIDRAKYSDTDLLFQATRWIRERRDELGLTNKDLDKMAGVTGGASHWTALPPRGQPSIPTEERWEMLEPFLGKPPIWFSDLIKPAHQKGENWVTRKIVGHYTKDAGGIGGFAFQSSHRNITEPTAQESLCWKGWGTALKPASEHWILIQKPISEHNIAANIKKYRTGGINIDGSRIPSRANIPSTKNLDFKNGNFLWNGSERSGHSIYHQHPKGRFPSNFVISRSSEENCPARAINDQAGAEVDQYFKTFEGHQPFFYCKKPHPSEKGWDNRHPTVKALKLMRYFCKMVTPGGGTILDPFMGSGTTGVAAIKENFRFIGIEKDESYFGIAEGRLKGALE